ncbi:HIT family protein [Candidatus Nomurabacteria bacterium]|nr:HIT family protein [Candidatus Nomurabacteria bacterium]
MKNDCIFCKIVKREIPAHKLHEDTETLAFLDINPVNIGHALVIPKKHFPNIYEIPEETLLHVIKTVKKISHAVKKGLKADGINVTMNNDPAAGQIVFHAHIHIIPRHINDGFSHWRGKRGYQEGEKEAVVQKITQAL